MNNTRLPRVDLQAAAKQAMAENGFEPDFPPKVQQQLEQLKAQSPKVVPSPDIRDLRNLVWSSIDNDTSRDLDQVEVAERLPNGETREGFGGKLQFLLVRNFNSSITFRSGSASKIPAGIIDSARF